MFHVVCQSQPKSKSPYALVQGLLRCGAQLGAIGQISLKPALDILLSYRTDCFETKRAETQKLEAPFIGEISGLAIIKKLDRKTQNTMMLNFNSYGI